jgi:WD40 repeat protein
VIAAILAIVAFVAQQRAEDASVKAEAASAAAQANEQVAEQQRSLAEQQRSFAEEQAAISRIRELASQARVALDEDPELAILLAVEAVSVDLDGAPLREAVEALHVAVSESRARFTVPGHLRAAIDGPGDRLLVPNRGEDLSLLDTATGEVLFTSPVPAALGDEDFFGEISMAVSFDGSKLATGRSDGTIALWSAESGLELATTNDVQRIWTDAATGAFTLAYGDAMTDSLAAAATAAEIEEAIEALAGIEDVAVAGLGTADDPWQVNFTATSSPYVTRLVADSSELGSAPGTVGVEEFEGYVEVSVIADTGSFVLSLGGVVSDPVAADSTPEQIEAALESLPEMPDVVVFGEAGYWEVARADESEQGLPSFAAGSVDLTKPGEMVVVGRGHDHPDESGWGVDGIDLVEFSDDGLLLASRGWDETVRIWDATTLELQTTIDVPVLPRSAVGLALSPDGALVAAPSGDATRIWNTNTGELLHELYSESSSNALDVDFFPDGTRVAVGYMDAESALGIWDLETQTEYSVSGPGLAWVRTADVSADGSLIAAGDDGGVIHVVEPMESGGRYLYSLEGHRNRIMDLAFADTGSMLLSVSDQNARLWDLGLSGTSEWMTLESSAWGLPSVAYSPDGSLLARGPVTEGVAVANASTGEDTAFLGAASGEVADLAFSPDGRLLVAGTASDLGAVLVWDTATWELAATLAGPEASAAGSLSVAPGGLASSVDFNPDGSLLAATVEGRVGVWDTGTWGELYTLAVPDPSQGEYRELAFRPSGEELAARGTVLIDGDTPDDPEDDYWGDAVAIFDIDGNYLRTCCEHFWLFWAASVAYSPDGTQLVTAGVDYDTGEGTVIVWDATTGEQLSVLKGHPDVAWDAVFSPDGSLIASGSGPDLRVWDAATGSEMLKLIHGDGVVFEVNFSPDGSRLASIADTVGTVRVWALDLEDLIQIAEDRLTRTFTAAECEIYDIDPCPALE